MLVGTGRMIARSRMAMTVGDDWGLSPSGGPENWPNISAPLTD